MILMESWLICIVLCSIMLMSLCGSLIGCLWVENCLVGWNRWFWKCLLIFSVLYVFIICRKVVLVGSLKGKYLDWRCWLYWDWILFVLRRRCLLCISGWWMFLLSVWIGLCVLIDMIGCICFFILICCIMRCRGMVYCFCLLSMKRWLSDCVVWKVVWLWVLMIILIFGVYLKGFILRFCWFSIWLGLRWLIVMS